MRISSLTALVVASAVVAAAAIGSAAAQAEADGTAAGGEQDGGAAFERLSSQADAAHAANNLAEAVDLYAKALDLQPTWLEGRLGLGAALYGLGRCEEATEHLGLFTREAPGASGPAWVLKGLCELQLARHTQAFADLQRGRAMGLGENPQLIAVANFHVALLLIRSGQFEHAFKMLETFALHEEKTPSVVVALGLSTLRLPLLPDDVPADKREMVLAAGAAAYEFARSTPEAGAAFEALVQRYPDEASVHHAYGAYLVVNEPAAAAVPEFEAALRLDPKHVMAMLQLAFYYLERGQVEQARPYALDAVREDPGFFAARLALGRVHMDAGETQPAVAELEEAARLAPDSPQVFFHLARAYHMAGRRDDAEKARATFAELNQRQRPSAGR